MMIKIDKIQSLLSTVLVIGTLIVLSSASVIAQDDKRMIRIARISVDKSQLEAYKVMLKDEIETSVRVEPGVITLYAVYDQKAPSQVTVFEIYASQDAYQTHIKTPHFLKYKNGTSSMVTSLELLDVSSIAMASKK